MIRNSLVASQLPLLKGAKNMVRGEGIIVLLQWLWERRGSVQREGQARQGCLKRVCPRALQGRKANQAHTDTRPTKSERDSAVLEGLVWGEGWCGTSCTDTLTKILTPCRYGKCFKQCWRYISLGRGGGATVFCVLCRIFDRLRRYNNRSCQKVEIAKQMSYDIIIKL